VSDWLRTPSTEVSSSVRQPPTALKP
jgi:hypothetical protein